MYRTFRLVSLLLCLGLGAMPQPAAARSGPTYPIVDTGQSACYNACDNNGDFWGGWVLR
ncbi:MAG: hypothetical protein Kow0031_02590 [Anaerolineae bacterium]